MNSKIFTLIMVLFAGLMLAQSGLTTLDGVHNVIINIYDSPSGGALIRTETLSSIRFHGGISSPDMFETVRGRVSGYDEVYLEISIDGEALGGGRIPLPIDRALRRDTAPDDAGESLDDPEVGLIIGQPTEILFVESAKTGFGDSAPNEKVTIGGAMSMKEADAPPTGDAGYGKIFVNNADGKLYYVDELGEAYDLTSTGTTGVRSVSSSDHIEGRTSHMRFVPGESTVITESSEHDTIYIRYDVNIIGHEGDDCPEAPPVTPTRIEGPTTVCAMASGISYAVPPVDCATFYSWTLPVGSYISLGTGTNTAVVNFGNVAGNIEVRSYNTHGDSDPISIPITMNHPPGTPGSITGSNEVCSGSTGSYSITPVTGATAYTWSLPPAAFITSGYGTSSVNVTFGSGSGNICVSADNSCGTSETQCMAITVYQSLTGTTPGAISGLTTVCANAIGVSYSISAVEGATSYNWTLPAGATVTSGSGTNSIIVDFGTTGGTISVTAENICGLSDPRTLSITVNPTTVGGSISGADEICYGSSTGIMTLSGYTGTILDWESRVGTGAWSSTGATDATYSTTPDTPGTWHFRARVQSGVCPPAYSSTHSMTVSPTTVAGAVTGGTSPICPGDDTGTMTLSGHTGNVVRWQRSNDGGASWTDITHTGITYSETIASPGSWRYRAEVQSGSCPGAYSASVTIVVLEQPAIIAHPSDIEVDEGDPAVFSVTASGPGLSYQWQVNSGSGWSNVGSDSPSYNTGATTESMDGYQYRCVVSGTCSPSVTSDVATLTVTTSLYEFTSHTFTNCGATGRNGPNLSACRSAYSSTSWASDDAFFNMTTQGIQEWTVPHTGRYRITAAGARGGNGSQTGGNGARMRGDFDLVAGDVLNILVGQQGVAGGSQGGGGGGTFVWIDGETTLPIIAAGGGGGGASSLSGIGGQTSEDGTAPNDALIAGGTGGGPGQATPPGPDGRSSGSGAMIGGSGAGWTGNGLPTAATVSHVCSGLYVESFRPLAGGIGGIPSGSSGRDGGFGGGGSGNGSCSTSGGGGGGGYSGGAASSCLALNAGGGSVSNCGRGGGGGGSYNSGTNQSNSAADNSGHGYVTVEFLD